MKYRIQVRDAIFFAWNNVILRTKSNNNNNNQKDWQCM